jgi:phosphoribosyl-ATP pyrophosphohydrolase/phosphoribosyl-AMP cyclohydrolase
LTHFWSRSRNRFWQKGETSGHIQKVKQIAYDCDADCLLVQVEQVGVACHTGNPTCFYRDGGEISAIADQKRPWEPEMETDLDAAPGPDYDPLILERVYQVIQARKAGGAENSYVRKLISSGQDRILKKIGEEAGELIIGSKNNHRGEILHEMTDLWFHSLVLLGYHEIPLYELLQVFESRFGTSGLTRGGKEVPPLKT